jgi:hypothetical protein
VTFATVASHGSGTDNAVLGIGGRNGRTTVGGMDQTGVDPARFARWISWLDDQIEASAESMRSELGGATACRVHKDGRVTGGMKYQEGRMAAFAEARRLGASGSDDLSDALATFERRWLDELEHRASAEQPSRPWVAYATGGAEAARAAGRVLHEGP